MKTHIRVSLAATFVLAAVTGLVYPFLVTAVAQTAFPGAADGSLVHDASGNIAGSLLIGQNFTSDRYFHGRPSAAGSGYDATSSGGSNLGPSNPALYSRVSDTVNGSRAAKETTLEGLVPVDAATTSGSGLDPHITLANAIVQAPRVAKARNLSTGEVLGLVRLRTEGRDLGFMGEPRVSVLALNLALDRNERAPPANPRDLAAGDPQVSGIAQAALLVALVAVGGWFLAPPLVAIFRGGHLSRRPLAYVEGLVARLLRVDFGRDMEWREYLAALLVFSGVSILFTFLVLLFQFALPLNSQGFPGVRWDVALNTAVSFGSNTNWQAYAGETTMSHLSQMVALTFQNFVSAAVGIAAAFAVIRGFTRRDRKAGLGNFWADLVRGTLFVLLPLAFIYALFLASQGVPQTFTASVQATTLEGETQTIALGPVASQVAIKLLGTNGGGFFNANSAHPFENPTPLVNFTQYVAILLLASALIFAFGRIALNRRHGIVLWVAMAVIFVVAVAIAIGAEQAGNPVLARLGVDQTPSPFQAGGNMEGKEVRFGIYGSALYAVTTTVASCGSVNSMHDSFMPIGGAMPLSMILLGEIVYGGVGSGLYTLLVYVILTIFLAGLMVGRTPEYLGQKIESYDMKMVMIAVLVLEAAILFSAALAISVEPGRTAFRNPGPHGLSELLYATGSTVGNNGSAFGGLDAARLFYTLLLSVTMLVGRYAPMVPILALAGNLAPKQTHKATAGTFPIDGALFGGWLIAVIIIVIALTFFPALVLGPVLEHMLLGVSVP